MTSVAGEIDDSLDPFADANLDDPYSYYELLRAEGMRAVSLQMRDETARHTRFCRGQIEDALQQPDARNRDIA